MTFSEKLKANNLDEEKIIDTMVNLTVNEPICLVNIQVRINKNTFNVKWKNKNIKYNATFDKKAFEKEEIIND